MYLYVYIYVWKRCHIHTIYIYICVLVIYIYMHMSVYIPIQFISTCVYYIRRYCLYIYIPCLYACMYLCIYRFLYTYFPGHQFFYLFWSCYFLPILEFKTSPESRTGVAIQFHEPGVWQWIPRSTEGPAESLDSLSSGAQAVAFWPKIEVWEIPIVVGLLRIHSGDLLMIDPDLYN